MKICGGYLKAILLNGQEAIFGRDAKELVGRLKFRTALAGIHSHLIERALEIAGRK